MPLALSPWKQLEDQERSKWSDYFAEALTGEGQEYSNRLWWKLSDLDTLQILNGFLPASKEATQNSSVLEVGCGSGKSTFLLLEHFGLDSGYLVDLSRSALEFAKTLVPPKLDSRFFFVQASGFALPFADGQFKFCWNVGVVEHYPRAAIVQMVQEMLRVTSPTGVVVVGIPNATSIATQKAWLLGTPLGRRLLKWVPGYRFDTEILYKTHDLRRLFERECRVQVKVAFAGSILWVGAPEWMVQKCHRWVIFNNRKFLTYFILSHNDSH